MLTSDWSSYDDILERLGVGILYIRWTAMSTQSAKK